VKKVDRNSVQLRDAINGGIPIIITTLQKFPVIYQEVNATGKRFAVIVDEAHSSQTGRAATKLKAALANIKDALEEYAHKEKEAVDQKESSHDSMWREMAAQGTHDNLSFFAFTATPKDKTLQIFGEKDEEGQYHPFHIYSMRQAIEEGFILDVLKNYTTYKMYYRIAKKIEADPKLSPSSGLTAIRQFQTLHPHNIEAKTRLMLEHYLTITSRQIGGQAKAMVVTASRLQAVLYLKEFQKQLKARKLEKNVGVLIAFSGEVDFDGEKYTEEGLNRENPWGIEIKESSLPKVFHTDEFRILIVAEKYQTGFDEPLLHTMFVDKKLTGVKAVQTLSRLNRTRKGKSDTFVLDFVNSAEDMKEAFEPYYEETALTEGVDPNVVYDIYDQLKDHSVIHLEEVDDFADIFYSREKQTNGDLGLLHECLRNALLRYRSCRPEEQEEFKKLLVRFNRHYAFVSQVWRFNDEALHKFSVYARFLAIHLPKGKRVIVHLDNYIRMEYYKLVRTFKGEVSLKPTPPLPPMLPGGGGSTPVPEEQSPLSELIKEINRKYGDEFTSDDKVKEMNSIAEHFLNQEQFRQFAQMNGLNQFLDFFKEEFETMISNSYSYQELLSNAQALASFTQMIGEEVYRRLRS
jgi:type I restriction enzyme R subunit